MAPGSIRGIAAYGVNWDEGRSRLWALGDEELLRIELEGNGPGMGLLVEKRWRLPSGGGHDLFPCQDPRFLFVTTNTQVYRFDTVDGEFVIDQRLAGLAKVKSVDQHPRTGEIVYQQATAENWWSDTIRFAGSDTTIRLGEERLYKVRWDFPRPVPE